MKGGLQAAVFVLLGFSLAACGVSVRTTAIATTAPPGLPSESPVQMFTTRTPDCPYEEIALLRAAPQSALTRWQRVVDTFVRHVRQLGGDGVVMAPDTPMATAGGGEATRQEALSGTVIRFEDPGCRR